MKIKAASQCLNGTSGKGGQNPGGFTLIELVVVTAIMAILATMLLPALAMSKDRGQGARCLGNLRQLTIAWLAYTSDNQGYLVPNGNVNQQPSSLTDSSHPQWCPGRQDEWQEISPVVSLNDVGGQWIRKGLLYPFVGNTGVYKCPADTYGFVANGSTYPHSRSMSMNCWLSPITVWGSVSVNVFYTEASMIHPGPANLFVFIDENPYSINDGFFVCQPTNPNWVDGPATYHNGACGIAFADGHAEIHRWHDGALQKFAAPYPMGQVPAQPALETPPNDLNWLESVSTTIRP